MIINLDKTSTKEDVGNKAYNLMLLKKYNYNVPNGIVISSKYTNTLIKNIKEKVLKNLNDQIMSNKKNFEKFIKEINNDFNKLKLDEELIKDIKNQLTKNKTKKFVVRSSTNFEDSKNFSFAGQFDSFLNVKIEELEKYILKCIKSTFSRRMLKYTFLNKIKLDNISISVIIQEMIIGKYSGIAFSKNPINNNENEIIIDIGPGLCNNYVSGKKNPNTYILKKNENIKTCLSIENKIKNEDEILKTIKKNILEIEKKFENFIDIEFTFDKENNFFILQARPITN
ncbi:MAG: PEP/pyruvate-binding domain-containing protein [Candidatus Nanoarchaeia archaeon]|nr:PEP/pyruvate-binding domain-containing protein [Candidatus Nanoarchaeia archaeon]